MEQGIVKMYNSKKRFGFIIPDSHSEDLFVHVTGLFGSRELKSGDRMKYNSEQGKKGLIAVNVKKV